MWKNPCQAVGMDSFSFNAEVEDLVSDEDELYNASSVAMNE